MKLTELEPVFLKYWQREVDQTSYADTAAYPGKRTLEGASHVETLEQADGIRFTCPKCGHHQVMVWFRQHVPPHILPGPGRWDVYGKSFDDLSLHPSIALNGACDWHGFIQKGDVT